MGFDDVVNGRNPLKTGLGTASKRWEGVNVFDVETVAIP